MESLWSKSVSFEPRKSLGSDITADTVVIGAGIAGLLTAYRLKEKGISAAVIEANVICGGQTKNTTAKITSQHGAVYGRIISGYGEKAARQYAAANQKAIGDYESIIKEKGIDCDFERKNAVLYTLHDKSEIEKEASAAKRAGIDCFITDKTDLPFSVKAALVFKDQAQFNPLKFLKPVSRGLDIYEHTPVIKIKDGIVFTDKYRIKTDKIVFAGNYPFVNFPGLYFLKMSRERSYVVSSKWNGSLDSMYIDAGNGLSFRTYGDQIIIGGGAHRTGKPPEVDPYKMLVKKGRLYVPEFRETARWSAQDCITLDGIPYIGRFSSSPDYYIATGFNKWGMTSSMASANAISDMIAGKDTSQYEVFSPRRFSPTAQAKNFCKNTGETVKGFAAYLKGADLTAASIRRGTAGIIKYKGEKAGAYRDENGKIYIVSLKCPHLKCMLKWNPCEKAWECPCHGSRYSFKGELIDGPAQANSILLN